MGGASGIAASVAGGLPGSTTTRVPTATTATIECQMVGGMLGEAPVADEYCRQAIIARVGADRQDGKRCRGE